jgi:hypothetical protein
LPYNGNATKAPPKETMTAFLVQADFYLLTLFIVNTYNNKLKENTNSQNLKIAK